MKANLQHTELRYPANGTDVLAAERRAFERQRTRLLRRYVGQYVALYHGEVVGHAKDDESLAQRMFAKFGNAPFYIARVEQTPTACELPSPELL